ncbi:hypothetical protein OROGR_009587 [Orobanche gracilis]
MGRAKLNMELITKEKSRNVTFKKRKDGLIRKIHEFTTLCDVSACMIIYGPKQEKGSVEPEIWPQKLEEVNRIIGIYKAKNKDSGNKTYGLSDFFHDRRRKIEDELAKQRKKTLEAKYPMWLKSMDLWTEARLRAFAVALIDKVDYVKSRIEFLSRNREGLDMNLMDFRLAQSYIFNSPGVMRGVELEIFNQQDVNPIEMHVPIHYPTNTDHHHHQHHHQDLHATNQNSTTMLLRNDNNRCMQFGGSASINSSSNNNNIQYCSSYKGHVFYDYDSAGRGMMDPAAVICHNTKPLARFYGPSVPVPIPVVQPPMPYMQMMPSMPVPPPVPYMQFPMSWENSCGGDGQEDSVSPEYHMNHNRARYY